MAGKSKLREFVLCYIFIVAGVLTLLSSCDRGTPVEWEPRVVMGESIIRRSVFLDRAELGNITDISLSSHRSHRRDGKNGLTIVGNHGAVFSDQNGGIQQSLSFGKAAPVVSHKGGHVVSLGIVGNPDIMFMDRGGGWQAVSVYDQSGKQLWAVKEAGGDSPNDIAAGDLNDDGILDFVVGFNGDGGVRLFDHSGKLVWKEKDSNVWHVEIVDTNNDKSPDILHSNAAGQLIVRDQTGKIKRKYSSEVYFGSFTLCRFPDHASPISILQAAQRKLVVTDLTGKVVANLDAPATTAMRSRGTPVKFYEHEQPYFAAIVEVRATWERSVLYIYSPSGNLVYQEILPARTATLFSLRTPQEKTERLLVGGQGKVWQYWFP